jgi:hypothetical protein
MRAFRSRPAWPAPLLIDLAAGRQPVGTELSDEVVRIAFDHRMGGLLWTWAKGRPLDERLMTRLAVRDLRVQAHQARVWVLLERCACQLRDVGIEVASIKGPTTEARWYQRPGERPTSDVDLWLSPHQLDRAGEALRLLQPDHPWVGFFADLAVARRLQTVTLRVDGIEVDLHLDLLKTGLPMRGAGAAWASSQRFVLPGGTEVPVLDAETALLHFLVHLNKDRFQRLLGYADVARIIQHGVDWSRVVAMAEGEGLAASSLCSLEAVLEDLSLEWPREVPSPPSRHRVLWRMLWGPHVRLRGSEGRRRFRRRQLALIPLSSRQPQERLKAVANSLLPPIPVLRAAQPGDGRARPLLRAPLSRWTG